MMRKMHQAMQDDAIRARIHPAFIPLTGLKSHMAKFPARLPRSLLEKTEISGTEPACPFRAEKRSAQASAHLLPQAQGELFCVLTVFVCS